MDRHPSHRPREIIVCGAGPAALAMALALGRQGFHVAVCGLLPADTPDAPDTRTAALFRPSIGYLRYLDAWSELEPHACPMRGIRIVDTTHRLLRAPETRFDASDIDAGELGFNCPNPAIVQALLGKIAATETIDAFLDHRITDVTLTAGSATVHLHDNTTGRNFSLAAPLIAAGDGRRSIARTAANITTRTWPCRQSALTVQFRHTRPHGGYSTEFHGPNGPFTTTPLRDQCSALVWVDRPDEVQARLALAPGTLAREISDRLLGLLGEITLDTPARAFPLTVLVANRFAANRVALVGEAAHAFPPIGAQGLNLSLRDVATLEEDILAARHLGHDLGGPAVLEAYQNHRMLDITARVHGVDALGTSLTSSFLLLPLARGAALHAANASRSIRRGMLRASMTAPVHMPKTMQNVPQPTPAR